MHIDATDPVEERSASGEGHATPGGFLAGLSHELRAPLNGILANIDHLRNSTRDPEEHEWMTAIEGHANRLVHLVNDLLDLTRMEANELELDGIDFDLRGSLETVMTSLSIEAEKKRPALRLIIEPDVPAALQGDAGRFKQAVFNIIAAAFHYSFAEGMLVRIRVTERRGDEIALEIRIMGSDGTAFPEEFRVALAALQGQRPASAAPSAETPLGLVVAQRIAGLMNGGLSFEGGGAEGDALRLMVWMRAGDMRPQAAAPVFPGVLRGLKALIVDTQVGNREMLKAFLEGWGVVVDEAGSTPAALGKLTLAAAGGQPFRLVLLDDGMSGLKGFDLAQQIKQRHDLSQATIVLLTSSGMRGDAARCRQVGVAAYLTKPIRPSRLLEALALALGGDVAAEATLITRHSLSENHRAEWGSAESAPDLPRADADSDASRTELPGAA
ncbi:MAG: response regulator [Candidatus Eisenbacteria bacterium]